MFATKAAVRGSHKLLPIAAFFCPLHYRLDVKDDKLVSTFQIANPTNNAQTITYWTDDTSACDAKTVDYAPMVEVPVDNANFTFFQITDVEGVRSPIYAMSHNPIFQCGNLAD